MDGGIFEYAGYKFTCNGSNHSPIVMNSDNRDRKNVRRFMFEVAWLTMEECERVLKDG